jgi:hypothetical protein
VKKKEEGIFDCKEVGPGERECGWMRINVEARQPAKWEINQTIAASGKKKSLPRKDGSQNCLISNPDVSVALFLNGWSAGRLEVNHHGFLKGGLNGTRKR